MFLWLWYFCRKLYIIFRTVMIEAELRSGRQRQGSGGAQVLNNCYTSPGADWRPTTTSWPLLVQDCSLIFPVWFCEFMWKVSTTVLWPLVPPALTSVVTLLCQLLPVYTRVNLLSWLLSCFIICHDSLHPLLPCQNPLRRFAVDSWVFVSLTWMSSWTGHQKFNKEIVPSNPFLSFKIFFS